jgi:class 3 adenylate cyclase
MESLQYHGHRIDYEPDTSLRDVPSGSKDYWFNVYDDEVLAFRLRMRVDSLFAHFRDGDPNELARDLGLRWVRGLIDLSRYARGETYFEERQGEWESSFAFGSLTEDRLNLYLLDAIERITRIEMRTGAIEGIDVQGVADVLGIPLKQVQDALAGLLLEGLVESYAANLGHGALDGACRITTSGAITLKQLREVDDHAALNARRVCALLITDIVNSTAQLAQLGDAAWRTQLERHYQVSHELVEQYGGRVVNHTGDGILAAFEMPSVAVECALRLRVRLSEVGILIRAAVHFGEVDLAEDASGITVHVVARVMDESDGNVLVTEVVRQMALGSPIRFESLGERELRDVPGLWTLYVSSL